MDHLRFFLKRDRRTLRTVCRFGGWSNGKRCYLATAEVKKLADNNLSRNCYLPEAKEVSDFLLAGLMADVLYLLSRTLVSKAHLKDPSKIFNNPGMLTWTTVEDMIDELFCIL